jgi:hypothetical protein
MTATWQEDLRVMESTMPKLVPVTFAGARRDFVGAAGGAATSVRSAEDEVGGNDVADGEWSRTVSEVEFIRLINYPKRS